MDALAQSTRRKLSLLHLAQELQNVLVPRVVVTPTTTCLFACLARERLASSSMSCLRRLCFSSPCPRFGRMTRATMSNGRGIRVRRSTLADDRVLAYSRPVALLLNSGRRTLT